MKPTYNQLVAKLGVLLATQNLSPEEFIACQSALKLAEMETPTFTAIAHASGDPRSLELADKLPTTDSEL